MKWVSLVLFLISCGPSATPRTLPDTDACTTAEKRLLDLNCKDSRGELLGGPNKKGVAFHDRCSTTQGAGVWLNPTCLSKINSCSEVDPCLQSQ